MQRELGETNHRYEVIGERLMDRQEQMEGALSGLKSYLIDVQQLMVYLNRAEPQVTHHLLLQSVCFLSFEVTCYGDLILFY